MESHMNKIFWLTGLPCSGKTTIAKELAKHLNAEILDGDEIRSMTDNNDFSKESRAKHMKSVAAIAFILSKHVNVIVALVSPLRDVREEIKKKYSNMKEIYLKCELSVCKNRDIKGMYAKAMREEITDFTGVQSEYEEPLSPDLIIRTDKSDVDKCVKKIMTLDENSPKALLIGRWQPLHKGHEWLVKEIQKKGHDVVLGIRHTQIDAANPHSVQERIDMIRRMFGDSVGYVVLPDISGVYYGRNVGYEVQELKPPEEIAAVSATRIRSKIETDNKLL